MISADLELGSKWLATASDIKWMLPHVIKDTNKDKILKSKHIQPFACLVLPVSLKLVESQRNNNNEH